jgi:hypothetical protein
MKFENIFTIWVVRNGVPNFVSAEKSYADARKRGDASVADREYLIKEFKYVEPSPCCNAPAVVTVVPTSSAPVGDPSSFISPTQFKVAHEPSADPTKAVDLFQGLGSLDS